MARLATLTSTHRAVPQSPRAPARIAPHAARAEPMRPAQSGCACGGGCPRCAAGRLLASINADTPQRSYLPSLGDAAPPPLEWGSSEPAPVVPSPEQAYRPPVTGQSPGAAPGPTPRLPIVGGPAYQREVDPVAWVPPDAFGRTFSEATYSAQVQKGPIIDAFVVSGEMKHLIHWGVRRGTGPQQQVDITSGEDPDITAANFRKVADDLEPGEGNRPPRTDYFASDLTMRHELFHVMHHTHFYRTELEKGVQWLNRRTARSEQEVQRLIKHMMADVDRNARARTGSDPDTGQSAEENAAYDAGAQRYQQRADEIRRKGRAGEYPA